MRSDAVSYIGGVPLSEPIREDSETYSLLKNDLQNSFLTNEEAIFKTRDLLGLSDYKYLESLFYFSVPSLLNIALEVTGDKGKPSNKASADMPETDTIPDSLRGTGYTKMYHPAFIYSNAWNKTISAEQYDPKILSSSTTDTISSISSHIEPIE